MNKTITLALAQSIPEKGDVAENIKRHERLIELAARQGVQLLAFPELSLTGYEPELAASLAFQPDDERLAPLLTLAQAHDMIIIVGAPLETKEKPELAAFVLFPDASVRVYTKRFLHPGEEAYFAAGTQNPLIHLGQETISLAICADIANPLHAQTAAKAASTIYIASAFITDKGYQADAQILSRIAREHGMLVMMANYGGNSGGFTSGGGSAVWSAKGELMAQFDAQGEGLVVASRQKGCWSACALSC